MSATSLAALISGVGVILSALISGYVARRTASKREYINTITAERAQWINNLRKQFTELNDLLKRSSSFIPLIAKNNENLKKLKKLYNQIALHTNPTEIPVMKHQEEIKKYIDYLENGKSNNKIDLEYIDYLQQVILKYEWSRLKVEAIEGEEIFDIRNLSIMIKASYKINSHYFKKNLKEEYIKSFNKLEEDPFENYISDIEKAQEILRKM